MIKGYSRFIDRIAICFDLCIYKIGYLVQLKKNDV